MSELDEKIKRSLKLLQNFGSGRTIEISYSGGKDSDVILELAKMAGVKYRAIYKCTTIDPPHTIAHCKSKGVEIAKPKEKFFDLVKRKGIPTMRARFCCEVLKEYKIMDYAVQGIRRSESTKRARLYNEPIICRIHGRKSNHVNVCLPILDWTNRDVAQFIAMRGIKCHPLYYDNNGNFIVERRLGCIGCPLKSDKGKSDYLRRPKFLKRLIECAKVFLDTHPTSSTAKKYGNVYDLVYSDLFCKTYGEYILKTQRNLFGEDFDAKSYLEKYFNIKL